MLQVSLLHETPGERLNVLSAPRDPLLKSRTLSVGLWKAQPVAGLTPTGPEGVYAKDGPSQRYIFSQCNVPPYSDSQLFFRSANIFFFFSAVGI